MMRSKHTTPSALQIRLFKVQLLVLLCALVFVFAISTDWFKVLAFALGGLISITGTLLLGLVALRPFLPGQERIYLQLMGRIQMVRLLLSAGLLAVAIIFFDMNPILVTCGFISVHFLSWILVFARRAKKRYHYS